MKNRKSKTIPANNSIIPMASAAKADERTHNVLLGNLKKRRKNGKIQNISS
jgi:hypothetical protein